MSATGRNLAPRNQLDFYPTPIGHVRAAFDLLPVSFVPTWVLDPGAGTGVWGQEAHRFYPRAMIHGIEIRDVVCPEGFSTWHTKIDFTEFDALTPIWDLVVGNPPYNVAEQFIRRSMALLLNGGYLLFLLRLNYLEGQGRGRGLWRDFPPFRVGVYSKRPSFSNDSHTDATGYMACLWKKGWRGNAELSFLDVNDRRDDAQLSLLCGEDS